MHPTLSFLDVPRGGADKRFSKSSISAILERGGSVDLCESEKTGWHCDAGDEDTRWKMAFRNRYQIQCREVQDRPTRAQSAIRLVDDKKRAKYHVEHAAYECHVYGDNRDNESAEDEGPRTQKINTDRLSDLAASRSSAAGFVRPDPPPSRAPELVVRGSRDVRLWDEASAQILEDTGDDGPDSRTQRQPPYLSANPPRVGPRKHLMKVPAAKEATCISFPAAENESTGAQLEFAHWRGPKGAQELRNHDSENAAGLGRAEVKDQRFDDEVDEKQRKPQVCDILTTSERSHVLCLTASVKQSKALVMLVNTVFVVLRALKPAVLISLLTGLRSTQWKQSKMLSQRIATMLLARAFLGEEAAHDDEWLIVMID
ncbi:hypothetical protein CABS02_08221 [Colletotrichum abscissum]|uniref:Uncharacterized protein n=1 Tax=Colletotrichum abscissum TaxID=1671311 RepID=A0A9P9XCS2_9PEZI|nr:hypothetical protein CABS02_08221 [Colletotrichum abscissum]